MRKTAQSETGFSLIELVVVLAAIAILAVIAVPSYQASIRKARRAEGKDYLHTLMMAQERYRGNFNRYAADLNSLGLPNVSQPGGYYALSRLDLTVGAQFVKIAVSPQGAQAVDACGDLTLDSSGLYKATGGFSNECG